MQNIFMILLKSATVIYLLIEANKNFVIIFITIRMDNKNKKFF